MKKKEVRLPFSIENKLLIQLLQTRFGVIMSNWTTQGMRYMNRYERLYRVSCEALLIALFSLFLIRTLDSLVAVAISFVTVHTIFWIFNGHFYVLLRHISDRQNDPARFISYVNGIHERVNNKSFLLAVVAFGSLSKGNFSPSSDFDVRFIRSRGFINSIRAFNCCTLERARAFLNAFPLDIYVFDLDDIKYKIKADEPPIVVFEADGALDEIYKTGKVAFQDFYNKFCEEFTKV